MGFDWKKTLGTVAPGLATALGGPVAGFATKALCGFFGISEDADDMETQLETAVKGMTPDQAIQLKAAEQQFIKDMRKLDVDVFKLEVEDKKSARKMYTEAGKAPQLILGVLIVAGVVALIYAIVMGKVASKVDATIIGTILGFAISEFRQLTGFFFGSSMGSKDKNNALANAAQGGGQVNLNDVMAEDLGTILDPEEFGEEITWEGEYVDAIVDEVSADDLPEHGVFQDSTVVHIAVASLENVGLEVPVPQEEVEFNGSTWRVSSAKDVDGLATMILVREYS